MRLPFAALGIALVVVASSCRSPQRATYAMTWTNELDHTCKSMRHVVLHFVDYPAYSYGYCSTELARYLDSLPGPRVDVIFSVYDPSAQLGGGDPIQIGSLKKWTYEFAHTGSFQDSLTGQEPRHPWEQLRH